MAETIRTKILEDALSAYTNKPFHEADWNRDVVAKLPDATPEEKALLDQYQGCVKNNKTRQQCFEEFKALLQGKQAGSAVAATKSAKEPTTPLSREQAENEIHVLVKAFANTISSDLDEHGSVEEQVAGKKEAREALDKSVQKIILLRVASPEDREELEQFYPKALETALANREKVHDTTVQHGPGNMWINGFLSKALIDALGLPNLPSLEGHVDPRNHALFLHPDQLQPGEFLAQWGWLQGARAVYLIPTLMGWGDDFIDAVDGAFSDKPTTSIGGVLQLSLFHLLDDVTRENNAGTVELHNLRLAGQELPPWLQAVSHGLHAFTAVKDGFKNTYYSTRLSLTQTLSEVPSAFDLNQATREWMVKNNHCNDLNCEVYDGYQMTEADVDQAIEEYKQTHNIGLDEFNNLTAMPEIAALKLHLWPKMANQQLAWISDTYTNQGLGVALAVGVATTVGLPALQLGLRSAMPNTPYGIGLFPSDTSFYDEHIFPPNLPGLKEKQEKALTAAVLTEGGLRALGTAQALLSRGTNGKYDPYVGYGFGLKNKQVASGLLTADLNSTFLADSAGSTLPKAALAIHNGTDYLSGFGNGFYDASLAYRALDADMPTTGYGAALVLAQQAAAEAIHIGKTAAAASKSEHDGALWGLYAGHLASYAMGVGTFLLSDKLEIDQNSIPGADIFGTKTATVADGTALTYGLTPVVSPDYAGLAFQVDGNWDLKLAEGIQSLFE